MARKEKPIPVRIVHEPISPLSPYKEPDRYHMSMRQIENGWIVNEHGYKDGKHFDREVFKPNPPAFPVRQEKRSQSTVQKSHISVGPKARSQSTVQKSHISVGPKVRPLPRATSSPGETKTSSFMAVDMAPPPKKAQPSSPLNVPSDAGLPRPKSRAQRLRFAKL